jgi:transcriptional regulator with XRE-family HTH domain
MTPLGRYIIRARERRGWTRAELSRVSGIPYTTLRNIEAAQRKTVRASEIALKALASAIGETEQERSDSFEEMRILAGYLLVASKDTTEQERRLLANLTAYPGLKSSLEDLFSRGDPADIDRAQTAIEFARHIRRPKESR